MCQVRAQLTLGRGQSYPLLLHEDWKVKRVKFVPEVKEQVNGRVRTQTQVRLPAELLDMNPGVTVWQTPAPLQQGDSGMDLTTWVWYHDVPG